MPAPAVSSVLTALLVTAVRASPPNGDLVTGPWDGASAAPLLGDVGFTTIGFDVQGKPPIPVGESISGPFENGYGAEDGNLMASLGCEKPSDGYVPAGVDTFFSEQMIAKQCDVELPRTSSAGRHIGLLDECGGQREGNEYNLHESFSCLYDEDAPGHSPKIGRAADHRKTPIFGKWEDRDSLSIPALDACNGHFGVTPESNGEVVYHHHVAGLPPFVIGCFGPAKGNQSPELVSVSGEKLVSTEECRALYPGCGDGDEITVDTKHGTFAYDPWCPCFSGLSNVPPAPPAPPSPPPASPSPPPSASPSPPPPSATPSPPPPSATPSPPPPSASPSPPPPSATPSPPPPDVTAPPPAPPTPWKDCSDAQLAGDIDESGRATLGDAVYVANQRLAYGETGINPMLGDCMEGDFDFDGTYTIADASFVAMAQFDRATYVWERSRRQLEVKPTGPEVPDAYAGVYAVKSKTSPYDVELYIKATPGGSTAETTWNALSVQFTGGQMASVEMKPKNLYPLKAKNFFQVADLSGAGISYPLGHVGTVTFEKGTNMDDVRVDYDSINTYVVQNADPTCASSAAIRCKTIISRLDRKRMAALLEVE